MEHEKNKFQNLLQKYVENNISPEEMKVFWSLIYEMPEEELSRYGLFDKWADINAGVSEDAAIRDRIYRKITLESERVPSNRSSAIIFRVLAAAAVFIGLIIFGYFFSQNTGTNTLNAIAVSDSATLLTKGKLPVKVLTLPDGSQVTLSEGSEITYDAAFNQTLREVTLKGEAYFDVAHDAQKPFLVKTGKYTIKVLGTAFNVKQIPCAKELQVAVTRGKVSVNNSGNNSLLGLLVPGKKIMVREISNKEDIVQTTNVAVENVTDWTKQTLLFDNDNWQNASKLMSRKYGVDVRFKNDAVQACHFTGDFTEKTLDECLDIICMLTKSKWSKGESNIIWIEGNGCD